MSFSEQTKQEIADGKFHSRRERTAFLSAVIHTAGSLVIGGGRMCLILSTENAKVQALTDAVTRDAYRAQSIAEDGGKRRELRYEGDYVKKMLYDCGILDGDNRVNAGIEPRLVEKAGTAVAYVKGAFLGAGSVTAQRYHLEIVLSNKTLAEDLSALLRRFNIVPKIGVRKDKYVVYLKDSQSISDCLALMGANKAVLELNNVIAKRQLGGYVNRATNCELHNLEKQVNASVLQRQAIDVLLRLGLVEDEKLLETARARLDRPEASYEELSETLGISKSGVKHRLLRLVELANKTNTAGGKGMIFKELEVKQIGGVTNHDAQIIVQRAMRFDSEIIFEQGTRKINAKSLMGVISMGLKKGDKLMVIVKGDDQDDALSDIAALFDKSFHL